jgi:hypothetical protein
MYMPLAAPLAWAGLAPGLQVLLLLCHQALPRGICLRAHDAPALAGMRSSRFPTGDKGIRKDEVEALPTGAQGRQL